MQSSNPKHEKVAQIIAQALPQYLENTGLILEDLQVTGTLKAPIVRVFVDLPDGAGRISETQLDEASRAVGQCLDDLDPLPVAYQLEVSTPGAERPLTTPRLWRRSIGSMVEFVYESDTLKGLLVDVDADGFNVKLGSQLRHFSFEEVTSGHSRVNFFADLED